jgi:hypothetical protein
MSSKKSLYIGFLGVAFITLNTIPSIYNATIGGSIPPIQSVVLMLVGLGFCFCNSVMTKNLVYILANFLGLCTNSLLLILILIRL